MLTMLLLVECGSFIGKVPGRLLQSQILKKNLHISLSISFGCFSLATTLYIQSKTFTLMLGSIQPNFDNPTKKKTV